MPIESAVGGPVQVTFLGTSSGVPTRARNVSAVALRLPQRAELWLFDCGEGTQHQFLRSDLRVSQLRRIFVTHMHGDHVFGLPGLLASLGLAGSCTEGLDLYGPDPLRDYLEGVLRTSSTRIGYPLRSHRVREAAQSGAVLFEDDEMLVRCAPLTHRVPAFEALRIENAWAGYYEMNLFDHNALLGAHPAVDNLLFATGFSGHGMQQAPAVGRGIAELIVHGAYRSLDLSVLSVARLAQGQRIIESNVIG